MEKSLQQAIEDFNNWKGAAIIYVDLEQQYFNTEVFYNDVARAETVLRDGLEVVFGKSERKNIKIGKVRENYIRDFVELLKKGYWSTQAEYKLIDKYPNVWD